MKNIKQKGFTLIEILVVVAVIGLLSVMSILALNNTRQKAIDASGQAELKMLWAAIELYITDNGAVPNPTHITDKWSGPGDSLQSALLKYLPQGLPGGDRDWLYCWNIDSNKFMVATTISQDKGVPGDIDTVHNWKPEECISSDIADIKPDCGREYINDDTKEIDNIVDTICDTGNPCGGKKYYCSHGLCDNVKCMSVTRKPNCSDFNGGIIDDFSGATAVCLGSDDSD